MLTHTHTGGVYVSLVMQVANPSDGISCENLRKCGQCVVNRHMWNNGGCNKTLKMHIALQNFGLHGRTWMIACMAAHRSQQISTLSCCGNVSQVIYGKHKTPQTARKLVWNIVRRGLYGNKCKYTTAQKPKRQQVPSDCAASSGNTTASNADATTNAGQSGATSLLEQPAVCFYR